MDRFELVSRKLMERNLYREHIPDGEIIHYCRECGGRGDFNVHHKAQCLTGVAEKAVKNKDTNHD